MRSVEESQAALREATRWYVRLASEDATEAERSRFATWCAANPEHGRAVKALDAVLLRVDRARDLILEAEEPGATARALVGPRWLLAAGVLLALMGGWALTRSSEVPLGFSTAIAERRTIELPDASVALLNAESQILVSYSESAREIWLKHGEVLFEVRNEFRPFLVRAGGGLIRVTGTRFNARTRPTTGVHVAVLEGTVEVIPDERLAEGALVRVRALQGLSYRAGEPGELEEVVPDQTIAWTRGQLIYAGERLEAVVRELNRYSPSFRIVVQPGARDLRVSGTFELDNPEGALGALQQVLPVRAIHLRDVVVLRRRPEAPGP